MGLIIFNKLLKTKQRRLNNLNEYKKCLKHFLLDLLYYEIRDFFVDKL